MPVRRIVLSLAVIAATATAAAAGSPSARTARVPAKVTCPVFPPSSPWNEDVSKLPVDPHSADYVRSIGEGAFLHPDFGSNPDYGIPYSVVGPHQKRVPIHFNAYGDESDKGPYPIPASARIEGGGGDGDRHVLVVQNGTCKLFELYGATRQGKGWVAGSGAVFNLRSTKLRHKGWTSADAAGLPIWPGLVRYDEVASGVVKHAIRVTVPRSQAGFINPARHLASSDTDPALPPMGLRLRLKAGFDISHYTGAAHVLLVAFKRYGLIVADNGSPWYFTGAPDPRWNDTVLDQLKKVPGNAFEAVKTGTIEH